MDENGQSNGEEIGLSGKGFN